MFSSIDFRSDNRKQVRRSLLLLNDGSAVGMENFSLQTVTLVSRSWVLRGHWWAAARGIVSNPSMHPEIEQVDWLAEGRDRRRIPRYVCSGAAQINCLPIVGACLRGRLRDLGLGGCWIEEIETAYPLNLGVQTELLMRVNSWVFRALGHVRGLRDRSGISVEFARMSAGGYNMLADVIAELERPRIVVARPRIESSSRFLRSDFGQDANDELSIGVAEPVLPAPQALVDMNRLAPGRRVYPLRSSIDIFI